MKVHILYPFKKGPWGGANQFLAALKNILCAKNFYCEVPEHADILLVNLNPSPVLSSLLSQVKRIKKKFPGKIILVRIDGPIFIVRGRDVEIDRVFFYFTQTIADGTIFQSDWSREHCFKLGLKENSFQVTISNAPDWNIFNQKNKTPFSKGRKIHLIASSWSANWKKGFAEYKWLDDHLDFSQYKVTFVGNSPITFKNIKCKLPMTSAELAKELKKNDIYITASQKDACPNSPIEAMHCGLPVIAFNDGGHPEITGQGGELFNLIEEVPGILIKIVNNYVQYQNAINLPTIEEVGQKYLKFMQDIFSKTQTGEYRPKRFEFSDKLKLRWLILRWKTNMRLNTIKEVVKNIK